MNQIIISRPAGDLKPQQYIPCYPCIVPGFVPVSMAENPMTRQQKIDMLDAYRKGETALTIVPLEAMADESGAIVITLYPELGRRA